MAVIDRFCDLYRDLTALDPEQLHTIYSDNVVFVDPITTHRGIEQLKSYFSGLTENTASCKFAIENVAHCQKNTKDIDCMLTWTMTLVVTQHKKPVYLAGVTLLRICNDRITYHRDYYDLGEMVYEHIPILGWIVRKVKKRLAK